LRLAGQRVIAIEAAKGDHNLEPVEQQRRIGDICSCHGLEQSGEVIAHGRIAPIRIERLR